MMLDGYDDANTSFGDYFVRQAAALSVNSTGCSATAPHNPTAP